MDTIKARIHLAWLRFTRFAERHDDETGEHVVHEGLHWVTEHLPHFMGTFFH